MKPRPDNADHPARILIVDDERHNRELLKVMLTPEGFLPLTAASGEEALSMVAQQPPDLILLDIMMPGMDGYQVAAKLKGDLSTRSIPIIMVTALDDRDARMLGLSAGAEDFLTKPVDRAELCVRVRNLLRLKAYGDYHDKYSLMLEGEVVSRTAALAERTKQAAGLTEQTALLDLAQDAIVVRDMQGRIVFWSRGAEVLYGWLSGEAIGRRADELLRTKVSEPVDQIGATLLRQGQWEGEAVHQRRDDTRVIVASRWALQRDADGAPHRVLTINSDITERKQADAERRLLSERLSLATAMARIGVWDWDLGSNTLTWDAMMFDIYGLPPVVPMPYTRWSVAVHPEDLPTLEAIRQRAILEKGEAVADFRIILADGSVRKVSVVERVVLDDRANVSRIVGVHIDVTERKEAEETLERSRKSQSQFREDVLSHVSRELRSPLTAITELSAALLGEVAGEVNTEQHESQRIRRKSIGQLQSMIDGLLPSISDAVTDALDTHGHHPGR